MEHPVREQLTPSGLHRVLVLVDGSDAAFDALDQAIDLAGIEGRVHALYVRPEPRSDCEFIRDAMLPGLAHDDVQRALAERLANARYRFVSLSVAAGPVEVQLADQAIVRGCSLVVLPRPVDSPLQRLRALLAGSLFDRVARHCLCPVMVAAPRLAAAQLRGLRSGGRRLASSLG